MLASRQSVEVGEVHVQNGFGIINGFSFKIIFSARLPVWLSETISDVLECAKKFNAYVNIIYL